jgi:hypothetical protein
VQPMGRFEEPLLFRMVSTMEFFLAALEYGHIMLGHLSKKNERLHTYGVQQPLSVVSRSWGQEAAADADAYAFGLLDKYLVSDAAKDERYQAGIDFLGYLRLAPQFFFVLDTAAEEAQYVFDNRRLLPALSQEERMAVADYLESALAKESERMAAALEQKINEKYPSSVLAVLRGDYPPPWARLELMRRALNRAEQPSADSTAVAFRDFGVSVLASLQVMHSDLMSAWIANQKQ